MKHALVIVCVMVSINSTLARDSFTTYFIQHFITNERKPTTLVFGNLCWEKHRQVKLVHELSKVGIRSLEHIEEHLNNISELKYEHLYHNFLIVIDFDCSNLEETFENARSKRLLSSPFRWLMLDNSSNKEKGSLSLLGNSSVLPDSDVVIAERAGNYIQMTEVHKSSANDPLIFTPRGTYNGTFTDIRPHREIFARRKDIMGHTLTMANVIQDSNTTQYHLPMEDRLEPEFDSIPKICWMDVKLVFEMLNATPRYIFSHRWGYKQNGQWSGMINDLHTGRADLGTNCLVSDKERLDVVTYTDMVAPFRVRFVFRQPPLSYVSNIYSLPFSTNVWLAIVVCAAVSTVALFLESKWESTLETNPTQMDGSLGDAFLLTMSAVGQQGCVLEPRKFSGRVMVWVFFAALMLLYAAYSANIVVLLQAPSNSIRTLSQLASSKITLAAHSVDYNHFVFKLHKDPVRVAIRKRVDPEKEKGQFYDMNEGVEKIRKGLFAFHAIVEPVYRHIESTFLEMEKCDLTEVDYVNGFDPFIPVKKDSPYIELIRVAFKRIREAGLQSALVKRLQVPKPRCSNKVSAFSSVGLLDMCPVIIFMVYGFTLALFIALVEICVYKISNLHTLKK
uniref:Ionotropic receptor 75p1 n=1 Tax=Heortia vitessoides TaxID=1557813 RepID=A0A978W768_9NEOP|nr:ionotropic receptor 75p1 [Heortia vitessoides]